MMIRYVNSNNRYVDFYATNLRATKGNFHIRKWRIENDKVLKDKVFYSITLTLKGSLEERKKKLDEICDIFETDVASNKHGIMYYGDYYLECYVISADTHISSSLATRSDVELEIYSCNNYWKKEKTSTIDFKNITGETNALKYPFTYPFTYKGSNSVNVINEALFESDAIIRVYGEAINPLVMVGDNVYQVNDAISEKEYIEINTSERTIYKFSVFGDKKNIFEKRNKQYDIFKRVPSGSNIVSANGEFKVDIVLIDKRSEPKWT